MLLTHHEQIIPSTPDTKCHPNRGIHANHMKITWFCEAYDAGYCDISDQLWLLISEIEGEMRPSGCSCIVSMGNNVSFEITTLLCGILQLMS